MSSNSFRQYCHPILRRRGLRIWGSKRKHSSLLGVDRWWILLLCLWQIHQVCNSEPFLPVWFAQAMVVVSSSPPLTTNKSFSSTTTTAKIKEVFSVAPMMAHTNRHYRTMFRCISQRAFLYTEMIPASQILQVYQQILIHTVDNHNNRIRNDDNDYMYHPEQIQEAVQNLKQWNCQNHLSLPPSVLSLYTSLPPNLFHVLQELLLHCGCGNSNNRNVVLQLGGRDPTTLGRAAAIGTAFGFAEINLNCGCPSVSVSGNSGGAALMKDATLVSQCLEAMSRDMHSVIADSLPTTAVPALSVKHRLGAVDFQDYEKHVDRYTAEHAYQSCLAFCKTITGSNSHLSKLQIHARLALLGLGSSAAASDATQNDTQEAQLWTPSNTNNDNENNDPNGTKKKKKIDHKRQQYKAKRLARQGTIKNRNIPPLRPEIVQQVASELSGQNLEIISNGGIHTISECQERLPSSQDTNNNISGVMVGRAAINHPCSFATVDQELPWGDTLDGSSDANTSRASTRQDVLERYMEYCAQEEDLLSQVTTDLTKSRSAGQVEEYKKEYRKRLVAAPFHLFMGEDNANNAYQRRLRKLVGRGNRYTAVAMLQAGMQEVDQSSLTKPLTEHVPMQKIETYKDFTQRSGAMQRAIQ